MYELSTTIFSNIKQYFQNYPFQETKQKHNAALHPIDSYTKVNNFYQRTLHQIFSYYQGNISQEDPNLLQEQIIEKT